MKKIRIIREKFVVIDGCFGILMFLQIMMIKMMTLNYGFCLIKCILAKMMTFGKLWIVGMKSGLLITKSWFFFPSRRVLCASIVNLLLSMESRIVELVLSVVYSSLGYFMKVAQGFGMDISTWDTHIVLNMFPLACRFWQIFVTACFAQSHWYSLEKKTAEWWWKAPDRTGVLSFCGSS